MGSNLFIIPQFPPHFSEEAAGETKMHKSHIRYQRINNFVRIVILAAALQAVAGFKTVQAERPSILQDRLIIKLSGYLPFLWRAKAGLIFTHINTKLTAAGLG